MPDPKEKKLVPEELAESTLEKPREVIKSITDPAEVAQLLTVRPEFKDMEDWLINLIAESGAILKGHFELEED